MMRSGMSAGFGAALFTVLCTGAASAQMRVYYHVGSWDAFNGQDADGKQVCGAGSTNPVDDRSLSLRFAIGGDSVLFEAKKPSWNIPANTSIPVVMQVGLAQPWDFQASGNGQIVQWTLDRNAMQVFDSQFRAGSSMTLTFPNGNEPPWTIGLNGSTAISNAFGRCVTQFTQQAATQNPAAAPPAQGTTQPFAQAPTQPFAPAQPPAAPTQLAPPPAPSGSGTTQP